MRLENYQPAPPPAVIDEYRVVAAREIASGLFRHPTLDKRATTGMVEAHNAGLPRHAIGTLWGGISADVVGFRLRASGVEMRARGTARIDPELMVALMDRFRPIAAAEMAASQGPPPLNPGDDDTGQEWR